MTRIIPGTLGALSAAIGELPGREVTAPHAASDRAVRRVPKGRRDYTARELREMADRAGGGDPPPGSPAEYEIRRAELSGDFERANALRREVKEKAPALARLARAAAKAERRAAARANHAHRCKDWPNACGGDNLGPCRCRCGALLVLEPNPFGVPCAWKLPDGSFAKFPDPREADG